MTDKLSRRDFLKAATVGAAVAAAAATGIERVVTDPHFINDLKVAKELAAAELSRDPEKIHEARKLALVWTFAETVSKFGKAAGYGRAATTLDHFIYGNGQSLDISIYLEETVNLSGASNFVSKILSESRNVLEYETGKSPKKTTELIVSQLKTTEGLVETFNPSAGQHNDDLFSAFGSSTYNLKAPEAKAVFDDTSSKIFFSNGLDISLIDMYDWELQFPIGLANKAGYVLNEVGQSVFGWFYKSRDLVKTILNKSSLSDIQKQNILDMYSEQSKNDFTNEISRTSTKAVGNVIEKLTGRVDLVEADLNQLKKIGAKDYPMSGSMHVDGQLEVELW